MALDHQRDSAATASNTPEAVAAHLEEDLKTKQVIVIRRDLKMRRGKEIAQGAHASGMWLSALIQHCVEIQTVPALSYAEREWLFGKFTKAVLQTPDGASLLEVYEAARAVGLRVELVTDAGQTEFGGVPTVTCCAIGPDEVSAIDKVTGPESALALAGKLALY